MGFNLIQALTSRRVLLGIALGLIVGGLLVYVTAALWSSFYSASQPIPQSLSNKGYKTFFRTTIWLQNIRSIAEQMILSGLGLSLLWAFLSRQPTPATTVVRARAASPAPVQAASALAAPPPAEPVKREKDAGIPRELRRAMR